MFDASSRFDSGSSVELPIAIVGIGCRFPGGVDSADALWKVLVEERDLVTEVPPDRWDANAIYDPQPGVPGKVASRWGAFIADVAGFEPEFFGLTDHEAERMDPQSRLLLETACEALEDAGLPPRGMSGAAVGVFAGHVQNDYLHLMNLDEPALWDAHGVLGTAHSSATGRISYLLGLRGPAVTLDTGVSSSLVAVHLGCQSLRTGEVDLALAGGVTLALTPENTFGSSTMGMLSPGRHCRAFDAGADGTVRGEGCGVVALKRLPDAIEAGDRILAVLRGTGVGNNGGSPYTMTASSEEGQYLLQQEVITKSGVDPARVGLVEAHGAGTPVGDPIEYAALRASYGAGDEGCALGAIKTNLGHCETAAGIAGLIKAVMAVRHGRIPANLHFETWNPEIDPDGARLFVPSTLTAWPVTSGPRLAAVSAHSMTGTNAHVIVEQAPPPAARASGGGASGPSPLSAGSEEALADASVDRYGAVRLYPLSAGSEEALADAAGRVADWLGGEGAAVSLRDVGFTLAHRRERRSHRAVVSAGSRDELADRLRRLSERDPDALTWTGTGARHDSGPVWVFSGEGSEWAGMGRALLRTEPAFAAVVDELEPMIADGCGLSLRAELESDEAVTGTARVVPVLFAVQVALAAAWRARGAEPAAVIGSSTGEVAAAVVAGALPLAAGAEVVCRWSAVLGQADGTGATATVRLGAAQVAAQLAAGSVDDAAVAALLSPSSTIIAGEAGRVHALVSAWQANDVPASARTVDVALNSPQTASLPTAPAADRARTPDGPQSASLPTASASDHARTSDVAPHGSQAASPSAAPADGPARTSDVAPRGSQAASPPAASAGGATPMPDVTFYGTVLDDPRATPAFDDTYWDDGLRRPVRFGAACAAALADGHRTFVEVSPGSPLSLAIEENAAHAGREAVVLSTLGRDDESGLAARVAAAYCAGVPLSWREHDGGVLVDVPRPPWAHRPLWLPEYLRKKRGRDGGRPLLGVHVRLPDAPDEDVWQADVGTGAWPWLRDHRVHGHVAMPAAGYAEMALAVGADLFGEVASCEVGDLTVHAPLFLEERTVLTTRGVRVSPDTVSVEFLAGADGQASRVARAVVSRVPAQPVVRVRVPGEWGSGAAAVYESLWRRNVQYGPCFSALNDVSAGGNGVVVARVALPAGLRAGAGAFRAHPVLLDACVQAMSAHPGIGGQDTTLLPVYIGSLRRLGDPNHATWCEVRVHEAGESAARADARLLTCDGIVVAELRDVRLGTSGRDSYAARAGHRMLAIEWDEAPHPGLPATAGGSWLVLAEQDDQVADALAGALGSALLAAPLSYPETGARAVERHLTDAHSRVVMLCPAPVPGAGADSVERARDRVRRLTDLVRTLSEIEGRPRLYVITREASTAPGTPDPNVEQAPLRAVCRVAGAEHPGLRITHVDVDADGGEPGDLAVELLADSPEDEVAWRAGRRYAARLRRVPLREDERRTTALRCGEDGFALAVRRPGDLGSLELRTAPRRAPGPGEVEIRVHAAGLTFRDVLGALDTGAAEGPLLGFDCAGEVVAAGDGVEGLAPGDRVAAFTPGAMASFVTVSATAAFAIPPALAYEEAATIPASFLLAAHAVRHHARLQPGERLLVHSATGGVGMAVIALARAAGARIHATAGTEARRDLLRGMGVEHVYDSRTLEFAEQVRSDTGGEGVDVVVNPIEGPALRAGLELLRPGGRFVHIGGPSGGMLGLAPFRRNVTFAGIDLATSAEGLPPATRLLREIGEDVAAGRIHPLPHTAYPVGAAAPAFEAMSASHHIGKLVIVFPQDGVVQAVVPPAQVPVVRGDGAYLITGGLGDLGLRLASHLAGYGAGRIVLNDRDVPGDEAAETIAGLRAAGTEIEVVPGDLADRDTPPRLIEAATATGLPLRGVAHAAAVIERADIARIDDDLLERVWAPKALGAWHLLAALDDHRLDWWLSFSSAASLIGSPGQGAYAAANGWLDAFTDHCRARGVPAQSVNWGAWTSEPAPGDHGMITSSEGLATIDLVLRHDRAQTAYLPVDESRVLIGDRARTTPFFAALTRQSRLPDAQGGDDALRIDLRATDPTTRHLRITEYIVDRTSAILRCDRANLDPDSPLADSGLDSLMSMRLRTGIERDLGIRVESKTVWENPTPAALAAHLAERL